MCRVCKVSIDGLISAIINVVGDKMMSSLTQQVPTLQLVQRIG